MNSIMYMFSFLLLTVAPVILVSQENAHPVVRGAWLGQRPPGHTPELFGKGTISTSKDLHSCPVFSPDGRMILWRVMNSGDDNGVYFMELIDSIWTVPRKAPFVETGRDEINDVPYFSADGKTLYFTSDRPVESSGRKKRIWYTSRENGIWTDPKVLEAIDPKDITLHWQFTISDQGVFYLTGMSEDGLGAYDIFKAAPMNMDYVIELLDPPINSIDSDICPYIAPDESYLIFASSDREDGYGKCDLYVCFRGPDGSWGTPLNLGPNINSSAQDWCPMVSHDGKYLFFTSFRNGSCNAYWMDSGIIDELRKEAQ